MFSGKSFVVPNTVRTFRFGIPTRSGKSHCSLYRSRSLAKGRKEREGKEKKGKRGEGEERKMLIN